MCFIPIAGDSEGDMDSFSVPENRPLKGARRKEYPKENRKEKYDQTIRSSEESQYSDQNRNETHKRKRVNKHKQEEKPTEWDRNLKRLLAEQKSKYDEDMKKLRAELEQKKQENLEEIEKIKRKSDAREATKEDHESDQTSLEGGLETPSRSHPTSMSGGGTHEDPTLPAQ